MKGRVACGWRVGEDTEGGGQCRTPAAVGALCNEKERSRHIKRGKRAVQLAAVSQVEETREDREQGEWAFGRCCNVHQPTAIRSLNKEHQTERRVS